MSGRDLVQVFEVGESFWCALVLPDDWSCRRVSGPYSTKRQAAEHARHLSGKPVAELEEMHRQLRRWLDGQTAQCETTKGKKSMVSVLQDWVMELPLREQGVLLTCVRGCDLTPKLPLDSTERQLVAFLRWTFLNPADPREVDSEPGSFMSARLPRDWKQSELGHYPLHWVSHLMHAYEVIAYRHPNSFIAGASRDVYHKLARGLHLHTESREEMIRRLSEDRIAAGTVVS